MSDLPSDLTPAEGQKLLNAALLEMAQETLDVWRRTLAEAGEKLFDYDDELIFDQVERAIETEIEIIALAVLPLGYVEIIRSPLLQVVGAGDGKGKVMVFPCADVAQLRRAALEFGDDRARRKLFGL